MPCLVTSAEVDDVIRDVLSRDGFSVSPSRRNGETGVDLLAVRDRATWHIETIAFKSSPPQRSSDFFAVFFRAVSRIKDGAAHIAIGLPAEFEAGLPQRAAQYGEAWCRIGMAFPELEIWLVDCAKRVVTRSRWSSWLV